MPVALWVPNDQAMLTHEAKQKIGIDYPGESIVMSNPKYYEGAGDIYIGPPDARTLPVAAYVTTGQMHTDALRIAYDEVGVPVVPVSRGMLRPSESSVPDPADTTGTSDAEDDGDAGTAPDEEYVDLELVARITTKTVGEIKSVLPSVDSPAFLKALITSETSKKNRKTVLAALRARIEALGS